MSFTSKGKFAPTPIPSELCLQKLILSWFSFTIYMTMVIIPYTRRSWRVKGAFCFIITAWWVQSWAWFSITGLLIADMATNMDFKAKAQHGIKVGLISLLADIGGVLNDRRSTARSAFPRTSLMLSS
jgi:arginine exporter protein ArgO